MANEVIGSIWSGLNQNLLASIYPVDAQGSPLVDDTTVVAPITDANLDMTANWQSPFEQAGADSKAPAIMSLLQQGGLESYVTTILGKGNPNGGLGAQISQIVTDFSRQAQGRTGMTKLNSTQIFTGSPPIKLPMTLHFRAFKNPKAEVQDPIDQLARWMLAQELAPGGALVEAIKALKDGQGLLKALLPSRAPQMVAFTHGGYTFSPMVIESISHPITVPRTKAGEMLHVAVTLTLATLTALDVGDWRRARSGQPTLLFNNSTR